jgi:hypothetical protein
MPSRRAVLALVASCALVPVALAQELRLPKVEVHAAEDVDFSAIKTYGWKDPVVKAQKPETHTSIVWYTERGLEQKGLTRIPEGSDAEPDVFVRYYAKAKSSVQGTPGQSQQLLPGSAETLSTTTSFDFKKVRDGTLILEMQQAADNKTIWRAGTDISRIDEKRIDAEVHRAVRMLLAKYPPKR